MAAAASPLLPAALEHRVARVRVCPKTNTEIEIAYNTLGDPANPALLLVQGLNTSMAGWDDKFCEAFVSAGFFVIRFDNRDTGNSTKLDHIKKGPSIVQLALPKALWWSGAPPYTLQEMADDAVALLDVLGIKKANLFGISMGGMISQTIAISHPDRVLSLTSVMSTTGGKGLPSPPLRIQAWFLKAPKSSSIEDLADFRVQMIKHMLCTGDNPDDLEPFLRRRVLEGLSYTTYRDGHVRQLGAILASPCREAKLNASSIPAVVMHGDADLLVPVAHGYRTASVMRTAKLTVLNGMGHYLLPKFYGQIVEEVLAVSRKGTPE